MAMCVGLVEKSNHSVVTTLGVGVRSHAERKEGKESKQNIFCVKNVGSETRIRVFGLVQFKGCAPRFSRS